MRENWDGCFQTGSALAIGDQKAQKHADGSGALFCSGPSAPLTGIQNKLTQTLSIKSGRIFPQIR
jgi:hypothetical protein